MTFKSPLPLTAVLAKKNLLEAMRVMKEFDFDVPVETEDMDMPAVDEEMSEGDEMEAEELMNKTEDELVLDILADAEELYNKVTGGEGIADEDDIAVDEEMLSDEVPVDGMEDDQVPSIDMLEAKKAARNRVREAVKKRINKANRIKALKVKIKESMKPGMELDDNELDASASDLKSEDESLMDTLYTEKKAKAKVKEAMKAKLKEKGDNVEFTKSTPKAPKPTGMAVPASDNSTSSDNGKGNVENTKSMPDAPKPTTNMVNVPANKEAEGWDGGPADAFFEEAKKRSEERKAYLKKILNEEDTPVMADQKEVEDLMGLKIVQKMGADPKLVESRDKRFVERYKGKKAFDSFLPFDQVVRPFLYYDKKLHST